MSEPNPKRSLSEISHLFLSSVRDRQTGGATRPVRKPPLPMPPQISIDLSPEEFAQVFSDSTDHSTQPSGSISAVIGTHLNGSLFDRVREYAGHLCMTGSRIGVIECDSSILRLMTFERDLHGSTLGDAAEPVAAEGLDATHMQQALEEWRADVDHWLVLLPSPRSNEARVLLSQINHWVLLSTCDHDGVVACYRTLKGLVDLHRPRISLALLDAASEEEADKVFRKLSSVSQQFLNWPLEAEPPVRRPGDVAENLVLCCRASREKSPPTTPPQWQVVSDFLHRVDASPSQPQELPRDPVQQQVQEPTQETAQEFAMPRTVVAEVVIPERQEEAPAAYPVAEEIVNLESQREESNDVIDLPTGETSCAAIISAVLGDGSHELVECPVRPPMCPEATLAVGRDRRITLLAVSQQGLSDLRAIGQAYQWLMQNRALIAMAMPQFAIDAHALPRLKLLVDQADFSAEILQPMLQSGNVTVVAYRKLRWAGRTGLLLAAA